MDKILSIIVPTYNMEKYLRRCLDSLLVEKGLESLEVWVINDGSKDSSSAIAHEYETKYPGVFKVLDKENGNYGSCINAALKVITGKYVKVLDADDWFDTVNLQAVIGLLKDIETDLIYTDFDFVDENDKHTTFPKLKSVPHYEVVDYLSVCRFPEVKCAQMHKYTYRSDIFKHIDYHQTEGVSYTDQEWILQPTASVRKFFYIPLILYYYLLGREGQTCAPEELKKGMAAHRVVALANIEHYLKCDISHPAMRDALNTKVLNIPSIMMRYSREYNAVAPDDLQSVLQALYDKCPEAYYEWERYTMVSRRIKYHYLNDCRRTGKIPRWIRLYWRLRAKIYHHMSPNVIK